MKRSFFQLYSSPDALITGWIVWAPTKKILRINWPWVWGTVGLEFQLLPPRIYWLSAWREYNFSKKADVRVPPYPPRVQGAATEIYEYPERIFPRWGVK